MVANKQVTESLFKHHCTIEYTFVSVLGGVINSSLSICAKHSIKSDPQTNLLGPVHPAYNMFFSACFFSWNSIFLSQQISQQCFSAGLSAQPNGA
jgi:hypothetical protein